MYDEILRRTYCLSCAYVNKQRLLRFLDGSFASFPNEEQSPSERMILNLTDQTVCRFFVTSSTNYRMRAATAVK